MPTPRERANAVVSAWTNPSTWDSRQGGFALPTGQLERLARMIEGAIDAQVADWMATVKTNGWQEAAKASHVVEAEPGKDYVVVSQEYDDYAGFAPREVVEAPVKVPDWNDPILVVGGATPPPAAVPEPILVPDPRICRHDLGMKWSNDSRLLVCDECGVGFKPGTCMRCGAKAASENGFVCGRNCA